MRYILLIILSVSFTLLHAQHDCIDGEADGYPCSNIDLLSHLSLGELGGPNNANDIWGWVDSFNNDAYALVGLETGTAFVRITDPVNPLVIGYLGTHSSASLWRDIKVYNNHAFIVSEASGHGLQVFDLTQLRNYNGDNPVNFFDTAHLGTFGNAHNIVINEESGYAYVVGANVCSGGLYIVDIQDPSSPSYAGCYNQDGYTHDSQCVIYNGIDSNHQGEEICFSSNEDTVTITNVTNKNNTFTISATSYPGASYTHQGWLTEDHRYFLHNDELDEYYNGTNTRTYIWDLINLDSPILIGHFEHDTPNIDHNLYIKGNYVYESNYTAGLRILELTDLASANLTEVGYFDVYPQDNGTSFDGTWSNYPFFDYDIEPLNDIVIISSMDRGLFVVRFNAPSEAELSVDYDTELLETTINSGESVSYNMNISNIGEEGSTLDYQLSSSPFTTSLGSDNFGNSWSTSDFYGSYDWVDIEDVGTLITFANNDEANGSIPIGFYFPIYNGSYSQCTVNPNGWIGFGGDNDTWDNLVIPTSDMPGPSIFPFWDDLNPENDGNSTGSGIVYYYSTDDMFVVTFDQIAHWPTNFEDSYYTFQVVMHASGEFTINYKEMLGDYSSATIGFQNQNGVDGILMSYNNDNLIGDEISIFVAQGTSWVSFDNEQGSLADGESDIISIMLDATDLDGGEYSSYVVIDSNVGNFSIPIVMTVLDGLLGDLNGDGLLNVLDVIVVVNIILNDDFNNLADMNQDGGINVQDIIILITIILEG